MRAGFTCVDGKVAKPIISTSLTPGAKRSAQRCTWAAIGSVTALMTNSPLAAMLRCVSLSSSWSSSATTMPRSAGSMERQMYELKGAALSTPFAPKVVTSAMGRGTTAAMRNL